MEQCSPPILHQDSEITKEGLEFQTWTWEAPKSSMTNFYSGKGRGMERGMRACHSLHMLLSSSSSVDM